MLGPKLRRFERKIGKIPAKFLIKLGFSANETTILGLLIVLSGSFIFFFNPFIGFLIWFFGFIFDAVDGSVAILTKNVTRFGGYLDSLVDLSKEIIVYSTLTLLGHGFFCFFAASGSLLLSYAKPKTAMYVVIDDHDWPALGEKPDRVGLLFFGIFSWIIKPQIYSIPTIHIFLSLIAIITFTGAIGRMKYAKKLIKTGKPVRKTAITKHH